MGCRIYFLFQAVGCEAITTTINNQSARQPLALIFLYMAIRHWKLKEKRFLQKHYAKRGARWCAMQLGRSETAVLQFCSKEGIKGKRRTAFKNGHTPWNKGKSYCHKGSLKPNHKHTANKVGQVSTRTSRGRSVQYIKYSLDSPPMALHRYLYLQLIGPIPDGHIVAFLDSDTMNTELSNLKAMSRQEHSKHFWQRMSKRDRERYNSRAQRKRQESQVRKQVKKLFKQ